MHIQDIFAQHRTTFSFEFFPPKTDEAGEELFRTIAPLQELQPSFVSVTYGAGGSTRERTHDLIVRIQRETEPDGRLAPDLRLPHPRRDDRDPRPLRRERASRTSWPWRRPATNDAELRPREGRLPVRRGAGAVHPLAAERAGPPRLRHRRRRLPRGTPGLPEPAQGDGLPEAQGGRRGRLHLHAAVLRQPRLLRLPRALRAGRDQGADRRRDHADHLEGGHGPRWPRLAAGARYPGEAAARGRPLRRRRRGGAASASTGRPSSAATCWTTTSAASTSTRSTAPTRPGRFTRTSASTDSHGLAGRVNARSPLASDASMRFARASSLIVSCCSLFPRPRTAARGGARRVEGRHGRLRVAAGRGGRRRHPEEGRQRGRCGGRRRVRDGRDVAGGRQHRRRRVHDGRRAGQGRRRASSTARPPRPRRRSICSPTAR